MPPEFKVEAQFMELYNEEILDLLSPSGQAKGKKSNLKVITQLVMIIHLRFLHMYMYGCKGIIQ
jgi:kinesin family protein 4/21/27